TLVTSRVQVMSIVLYGSAPERTLKTLAERVRDELTNMRNISQVDFAGIRRFELGVEVSEESLRKYGLTFDAVSRAVRESSLDLPGGSVKTAGGEVLIRTDGQRYVGREFEGIVVVSRPDGTELRLDRIGRVVDGYEDNDL
ncbi:MAG: efflux RND transporter permease subunit, partial [Planctomycetota bacterium]